MSWGARVTGAALAAVVGAGACSSGRTREPVDDHGVGRIVAAAASDLAVFWAAELPRVGRGELGDAPPKPLLLRAGSSVRCDAASLTWADLRGNARYCPQRDQIVVDAQDLGPDLVRRFGPLALAAIVAHEYGHAVQRRLGTISLAPVVRELQADCLAGTWLGHVKAYPTPVFSATDDDLALPLVGVMSLRDSLGRDPSAPDAHGAGFDRLTAMLEGIDHGAGPCLDYGRGGPVLTGQAFLSDTDRANAGNQPLLRMLVSSAADLNDHYGQLARAAGGEWTDIALVPQATGGCGGDGQPTEEAPIVACDGGVVVAALDRLGPLASFGDMAVGAEVGRAWGAAALRLSLPALRLTPSSTAVECLTGYWIGTLHPSATNRAATRTLRLSPGDLDEVAAAILQGPRRPRPLDRLRALQNGFHAGLAGCRAAS